MYVFISSLSTHHQGRNKNYINDSKRIRKNTNTQVWKEEERESSSCEWHRGCAVSPFQFLSVVSKWGVKWINCCGSEVLIKEKLSSQRKDTHLTEFTKRRFLTSRKIFSDSNTIFIYYLFASSSWDLGYHHTWLVDLRK